MSLHSAIKGWLPATAILQVFPEAAAHYQQSSSALHLAMSALQAVPAQASAAQLLSEHRAAWWLWNRRVSLSGIGPCRTRLARHAGSAAAMQGSGLTGCSCNVRQLHERRAAAGVVGSGARWVVVCLMIWLSCIKLRIYSRTWRLGRRCCAFTTQITVLPWSGWSAH